MGLLKLLWLLQKIGPYGILLASIFPMTYWVYPQLYPGLQSNDVIYILIIGVAVGWSISQILKSIVSRFHS